MTKIIDFGNNSKKLPIIDCVPPVWGSEPRGDTKKAIILSGTNTFGEGGLMVLRVPTGNKNPQKRIRSRAGARRGERKRPFLSPVDDLSPTGQTFLSMREEGSARVGL